MIEKIESGDRLCIGKQEGRNKSCLYQSLKYPEAMKATINEAFIYICYY